MELLGSSEVVADQIAAWYHKRGRKLDKDMIVRLALERYMSGLRAVDEAVRTGDVVKDEGDDEGEDGVAPWSM